MKTTTFPVITAAAPRRAKLGPWRLSALALCLAAMSTGAGASGDAHAPGHGSAHGKAPAAAVPAVPAVPVVSKVADKPVDGASDAPASAAGAGTVTGDIDPLERLRQRLTERLAAIKPEDAKTPYELHVRVPSVGAPHSERRGGKRAAAASAAAAPDVHAWGYEGEAGPEHWGGLCASGQRQSPIDIRGGLAVALEPVRFDYREGGFSVVDNGHTVQVNVAPGNSIEIAGRRYDLLQFHFHRPSEERLDGRQFDLSVHLVHKDAEGRLAVVALLVGRGPDQPLLDTIFGHVPLEKNEERRARVSLDPAGLLPADRGYYTYMGSLTTPPCSEGVLWVVLRQPVMAGQAQIDTFAQMYPRNARPPQRVSGRRILQTP